MEVNNFQEYAEFYRHFAIRCQVLHVRKYVVNFWIFCYLHNSSHIICKPKKSNPDFYWCRFPTFMFLHRLYILRPVARISQQGGPKITRGGLNFQIRFWMFAATGGSNVKGGGAPLAPHWRRPCIYLYISC